MNVFISKTNIRNRSWTKQKQKYKTQSIEYILKLKTVNQLILFRKGGGLEALQKQEYNKQKKLNMK